MGAVVLLLNCFIAGRLFFIEYLQFFAIVEPMFFAIARTIRERWPESGWWSLSNFGYPFSYAYQPLLHHLVALWVVVTGWTDARAYHALVCIFYVMGPVALYALMLRLTKIAWVSFAGALIYSLLSPAALLMSSVRGDAGWQMRRLHVTVVYADGPNIAALTLLLVAIFCLDRARERQSLGAWLLTAIAFISVPLTNIPAGLAFGMALLAYGLACEIREWPKVALQIAGACIAGFLLFAPWLDPSSLLATFANTQLWMDPAARFSIAKLPYYASIAATVAITRVLLRRSSFTMRFAAIYVAICAPIPLLIEWAGVHLLSIGERYHVHMELGMVMLAALTLQAIDRRLHWTGTPRWIAGCVLSLAAILLAARAIRTAHEWIREGSLDNRPEAKIAAWMNQYAGTDRAYLDGSNSFWFNHLTKVPQVRGCCNQNLLVPTMPYLQYAFNAGAAEPGILKEWFQVFGVRYVAVNGPKSLDAYPLKDSHKFDGLLIERWRDEDDAIYEVPLVSASLAHVVRPQELVTRQPTNGLDVEPLGAYRAAVMDALRPVAEFRFTSPSDAIVHSGLPPGFLYSVQMAYHKGWRASTPSGEFVPVDHDALNFMTLAPNCDGPCEVRLHFDGGTEVWVLRVLCALTWMGVGVTFWHRRKIRLGTP